MTCAGLVTLVPLRFPAMEGWGPPECPLARKGESQCSRKCQQERRQEQLKIGSPAVESGLTSVCGSGRGCSSGGGSAGNELNRKRWCERLVRSAKATPSREASGRRSRGAGDTPSFVSPTGHGSWHTGSAREIQSSRKTPDRGRGRAVRRGQQRVLGRRRRRTDGEQRDRSRRF